MNNFTQFPCIQQISYSPQWISPVYHVIPPNACAELLFSLGKELHQLTFSCYYGIDNINVFQYLLQMIMLYTGKIHCLSTTSKGYIGHQIVTRRREKMWGQTGYQTWDLPYYLDKQVFLLKF